ncbi:MAG: hypothetical protein H8E31_01480, partial [Planctomycetes bacterium]|nr:hypothetical protein [Planctomycetota bacterium]
MRAPAHRGRFAALLAAAALGACAAPAGSSGTASTLPEMRVRDAALDARAFAAEAAFLFPEESRALARSLMRAELARLEGRRLGIEAPAAEVDEALRMAIGSIEAALPEGGSFEAWARERYGRNGAEVRGEVRRHLAGNLLYQLVLRADAELGRRHRLHLLITGDEALARRWAGELRQGADPRALAGESADRGIDGQGERLLPAYLPDPLGAATAAARPGDVIGPLQLQGDRAWLVLRLAETLPPAAGPPPIAVLLEELGRRPVDPLEALLFPLILTPPLTSA